MSDKKTPLDTALEAMESLQNTIASDVADWAADKRMAWIYAILMGWDDEAMDEVAKKHKWKSEDVARLRRYHQALAALRSIWLGESGQGVTHWMPLPSPPSPSTT